MSNKAIVDTRGERYIVCLVSIGCTVSFVDEYVLRNDESKKICKAI